MYHFSLNDSVIVGQFYDHHGDRTLFIKHRPTLRQIFSLPSKEQHQSTKPTVAEKLDEEENDEFVYKGNLEESHGSIIIPSMLIQLCLMLFVCTCFLFYKKISLQYCQLILQLCINILITTFGVFYTLWDDNSTKLFTWFAILTFTNFITIVFFDKLESRSNRDKDIVVVSNS